MEHLFSKSFKLIQERSYYNKNDDEIFKTCEELFKCIYDQNEISPNIMKLMRFLEGTDPSGFNKMYQIMQQFRGEYINKVYKRNLISIRDQLNNIKQTPQQFQLIQTQQAEYQTQMTQYKRQTIESQMRVVGLQQAKMRLQQVQAIYTQVQQATSMLTYKTESKTLLEQRYFHQEFSKLAKQLQVKFLQDFAEKQQTFDLHDTMLVSDLRTQIQKSVDIEDHKRLFIKCFGTQKFNETLHKASLEYIEQYYQLIVNRSVEYLNEVDCMEFLIWLVKFQSLLQYQIQQDASTTQQVHKNLQRQPGSGFPSTAGSDTYGGPGELARLLSLDYQRILDVCLRYITKVVWFFTKQTHLSIDCVVQILLLMAKISIQSESLINMFIEQGGELENQQVQKIQQQIYKQITILIENAVKVFRLTLKNKFKVSNKSFDQWISVEHSSEMFSTFMMQELPDIAPNIDIQMNYDLTIKLDKYKHEKQISEQILYTSFIYSFALNYDFEETLQYLIKNPNFTPGKNHKQVVIQNMQDNIVPLHFYQTAMYINQFMYFIQVYDQDFNMELIVGSTVNCVNRLLVKPSVSENNQQFILDEPLFVAQTKLLSIFAELIVLEREMFSYYSKKIYEDLLEKHFTVLISKFITQQFNFRSALKSQIEYKKTKTVTQGSKYIFSQVLYLSKIVNPYPRISQIIIVQFIKQLELNLIDHYSQLDYNDEVIEVIQQEIEYLQQSLYGLFKMETLQIVQEFYSLVIQPKEKYTEFRQKYMNYFDPIKFKEIMMRVASYSIDREGAMAVVRGFQ